VKHALVLIAATAAAGAVGFVVFSGGGRDEATVPSGLGTSQSHISHASSTGSLVELERALQVEEGTRNAVGEFGLGGGRTIRLHTADTTDGKSCLIEEGPRIGWGSTCLENGLFGQRKLVFFVNSDGGPERFTELYVGGVAAPGIAAVSISKNDGSTEELLLTSERAFLFESTASDLERDVLPSGLRAFGRNGKLVQFVRFPSLR